MSTASEFWSDLPGIPSIQATPSSHGATDVTITIDGGYSNPQDAQSMVDYWARQLYKAGLPVLAKPLTQEEETNGR